MNRIITAIVLGALVSGQALAADDVRFDTKGQRGGSISTGVGARASVMVKLGGKKTVRKSQRLAFDIAAGPSFAQRDGRTGAISRQRVNGVFRLSARPGYSTELSLAGQSVATDYTTRGFAEAQRDGQLPNGHRNGVSTLGWIGIGVGAFFGVLLVAGLICEDNDDPCGIAGD